MSPAKPRFRQTIDFISQERIDKINDFRSTPEWKALSFSKKCLIILDLVFEQPELVSSDAPKTSKTADDRDSDEGFQVLRGAFLSLIKAGDFDGFSVAELAHILGCTPPELDALVDCMSSAKKEPQPKKRSPKT